ncbi:MAG: hypothetical protein BroJett029_27230 [Alphaproteobacteria bacterium]|nr:MAG: hypothetical protein BroJett029_27230 [Alphaproteobacteria bacterium]
MSLVTTSRLLAFIPDRLDAYRASGIAETLAAAGRIGLTPLRRDPYFLACDGKADPPGESDGRRLVLDVFPAVIASGRPLERLFADGSWSGYHDTAAAEAQYYNLIDAAPEEFRLESDVLGLKPLYQAQVAGGTLLASRIGDMEALFPELTREPDHLAVAEYLLTGMACDDRTLHRQIRLVGSGSCFHWRPGSVRITRARRPTLRPADAGIGTEEAIASLKREMTRCLERRSRNARRPFNLALSGGFDSRLTAALAKELDLPLELYSYGRSYHREIHAAKAVAAQLGYRHHILRYPVDNLARWMPLHLEVVEGQADPQQVQIANLLDIPCSDGQGLLHGFLGDGVCGHALGWMKPEQADSLDGVAAGIVGYLAKSAIRRFVAQLELPASEADILQEIRRSLPDGGHPYQALMIWDWDNRKRRMVGQQLAMLGTRLDVIAPFYSDGVLKACILLPRMALEERNIVRFLFRRHFPALARIPHAEEAEPILPSLRHQLAFTARKVPRKLATTLIGRDRILELEERFFAWREPDVWRLSFGAATPGQRAEMIARVGALAPDLERVFGIRAPQDLHGALFRAEPIKGDRWGHVHALRRLWSLAEYAHRLQDRYQTEFRRLTPGTGTQPRKAFEGLRPSGGLQPG